MEDYEVQDRVRRELLPGEQLLWWGRPRQGLMLRPSDALYIPFSLFWCGFAIFWEATVLKDGIWFFGIWGIPFVLVGLYIVLGRFLTDARLRARTAYGITDQSLRSLADLGLLERADGSGTITLGPISLWQFTGRLGRNRPPDSPALEGIPQVRSVYNLLLEAQSKAA
jgi:hypothetical protein